MTEKRKAAGGVPEPRIDGRGEGWKGKRGDSLAMALLGAREERTLLWCRQSELFCFRSLTMYP